MIAIATAMYLMNQHDVGPIKGKTNHKTSRTLSHDDETAENERISLHCEGFTSHQKKSNFARCAHASAPFRESSFNGKASRTF